jgi:hypothetical protein
MWLKCGTSGAQYTGSGDLKARMRLDIAARSVPANLHAMEVDNQPVAAI